MSTVNTPLTATNVNTPALDLLEEDDEFEEFPEQKWEPKDKVGEQDLWEATWDDEQVDREFIEQLRKEVTGSNKK